MTGKSNIELLRPLSLHPRYEIELSLSKRIDDIQVNCPIFMGYRLQLTFRPSLVRGSDRAESQNLVTD